jgi:hypothetical protein
LIPPVNKGGIELKTEPRGQPRSLSKAKSIVRRVNKVNKKKKKKIILSKFTLMLLMLLLSGELWGRFEGRFFLSLLCCDLPLWLPWGVLEPVLCGQTNGKAKTPRRVQPVEGG